MIDIEGPHRCHAIGCERPTPEKYLMCSTHWYQVPPEDRAMVWELYVPGQEISKTPTADYVLLVQRIIRELHERTDVGNDQLRLDL